MSREDFGECFSFLFQARKELGVEIWSYQITNSKFGSLKEMNFMVEHDVALSFCFNKFHFEV